MTLMELFGWVMGGASLLYFLVALAKPDWFLGLPAKAVAEKTRTNPSRSNYYMVHNFPG